MGGHDTLPHNDQTLCDQQKILDPNEPTYWGIIKIIREGSLSVLSGHVLGRPCTAVFADAYFHYSELFYSLTQDVTDIPTYLADAIDH